MIDQIFSVNQLSMQIKNLLEGEFRDIQVKGEVVAPKKHTSGHVYFSLKDSDASIDCVAWRSVRIDFAMTDGIQVICHGNVSAYTARSKYQMIVRQIVPDGIGAVMLRIEEAKKKLAAEGIFDHDRKLPLPKFPHVIGIVTSATGSVIHDMLHRLRDRYPCRVILYNASVQGDNVVNDVRNGIEYLQSRADIIIVARGGGSFEDLLPFNDEMLVRAIASSVVPIVTAIGHETDTTLVDYASSMRAPTPTAAIELITPDKHVLKNQLLELGNVLSHSVSMLYKQKQMLFDASLMRGDDSVAYKLQDLDYISADFDNKINMTLVQYDNVFDKYDAARPTIYQHELALTSLRSMIGQNLKHVYHKKLNDLDAADQLFEALSYKKTLKRGYCMAQSSKHIITSAEEMLQSHDCKLLFHDDEVRVLVDQDQSS